MDLCDRQALIDAAVAWLMVKSVRTGPVTPTLELHLEGVDEERRAAVLAMIDASSNFAPEIVSFALDGRTMVAASAANLTAMGDRMVH